MEDNWESAITQTLSQDKCFCWTNSICDICFASDDVFNVWSQLSIHDTSHEKYTHSRSFIVLCCGEIADCLPISFRITWLVLLSHYYPYSSEAPRCDMAFIEPMHRDKPNIIYLAKHQNKITSSRKRCAHFMACALYLSGHVGGLCIYCTLSRESAVGDLCWGNCIALFKFVWMSTISFIEKWYWQNENGITFLGNTAKHADALKSDINSTTQPLPPPLSYSTTLSCIHPLMIIIRMKQ